MFSNLASLLAAILYGTVFVVGIGIAIQLAQQSAAKKKNDTLKRNPRGNGGEQK